MHRDAGGPPVDGSLTLHDAIIHTAIELGTELGEDGVTMRSIAAKLGVSATALYQQFEGKAAILRTIRLQALDMLAARLSPAHDRADPVERLAAESTIYIEFARDNPWLYRVLIEEPELDWRDLTAEERERCLALHLQTVAAFERAVQLGRFRADLDPARAAFMLWAANHGLASMILTRRIRQSHPVYAVPDESAFIRSHVELVLRGFAR